MRYKGKYVAKREKHVNPMIALIAIAIVISSIFTWIVVSSMNDETNSKETPIDSEATNDSEEMITIKKGEEENTRTQLLSEQRGIRGQENSN